MMKRTVSIMMILLSMTAAGYAAESMLDYFKGRQPAQTPPAASDKIPIMQGNGSAIRMIDPAQIGVSAARFGNLSANTIRTTDPRLTDARTPTTHNQAAGTITGLSTVATSGSYNDLSSKPTIPTAAADISYTNTTYTTVAAALDSLLYVPISISSYTLNSSGSISLEIGSSYTINTLAWSTNKTSYTSTINTATRTSPYTPTGSPFLSNQSWTLAVSDGQTSASATRSVSFTWKRYWGVSASESLTDGEIIALSNEFSTSRGQSRTLAPAAQYMWVVYVESAGAGSFTVNGFLDTSWQLTIRDVVNASGGSTSYRIYRSANPLTGSYSVVVS